MSTTNMSTSAALRVLGLSRPFTQEQLKSAYRHSARVAHPDMGGDEETFQRVTKAYEVLTESLTTTGHLRFTDTPLRFEVL